MLSEIYQHPFQHTTGEEAAVERRNFCSAKGIAFSDAIYRCRRKSPLSSKDSDLVVVEKMNVLELLSQRPSIHSIILTGSSGEVSARAVFMQHLQENHIPFHTERQAVPASGTFVFQKREISVHSLYSTSGINIGRYAEAREQYRACLPPCS